MIPAIPPPPPTILFDIDGTLLTFRGLGRAAMEQAMHEVWGTPRMLEGISFAGATDTGVAARVAPGRDPSPVWTRYVQLLDEAAARRGTFPPLPGVVPLLDALAARGVRLGLLTGNLRASAEIKLRSTGLAGRFDFGRSGFADDGVARTEIAEAARNRCGDGPLTVVGDTGADVACARHIGARVLCVRNGFGEVDEIEAADRVVDDLTAPGLADWLIG